MLPERKLFLDQCVVAAKIAGHPYPEMAAAEAALESNYGTSQLATEAHNFFAKKQSIKSPVFASIALPTWECLPVEQIQADQVIEYGDFTLTKKKRWVKIPAQWVKYPTVEDSFSDRLATLYRLKSVYPDYWAALDAQSAEDFVIHVSRTWSTDPERANKVIAIYRAYMADQEQEA